MQRLEAARHLARHLETELADYGVSVKVWEKGDLLRVYVNHPKHRDIAQISIPKNGPASAGAVNVYKYFGAVGAAIQSGLQGIEIEGAPESAPAAAPATPPVPEGVRVNRRAEACRLCGLVCQPGHGELESELDDDSERWVYSVRCLERAACETRQDENRAARAAEIVRAAEERAATLAREEKERAALNEKLSRFPWRAGWSPADMRPAPGLSLPSSAPDEIVNFRAERPSVLRSVRLWAAHAAERIEIGDLWEFYWYFSSKPEGVEVEPNPHYLAPEPPPGSAIEDEEGIEESPPEDGPGRPALSASEETVPVTVHLPASEAAALRASAEAEGISRGELIRRALSGARPYSEDRPASGRELTPRILTAIRLLLTGRYTRAQLAEQLGISERQAARYLRELQRYGAEIVLEGGLPARYRLTGLSWLVPREAWAGVAEELTRPG